MKTTQIHKLITKASFYCGDKNPRDTYHRIFAKLEELGAKIPEKSTKKQTKLANLIQQGYLPEILAISLDLLRSRKLVSVVYTPMNMKKVLTGTAERRKINDVRHYIVEGFSYPSVTAILNHTGDTFKQTYIQKWKDNLVKDFGEKKALKKQSISTKIGDFTHACLESYLLRLPDYESMLQKTLAKVYQPILEEIDEVIAVELPVCHHKYAYAGTIDCVAKLKDGKTYLLDWKTSLKPKSKSHCKDYYQQAAAYCLALYQTHGIKVDGFKICVGYRQVVGMRNPRRFDCHTETDIRTHLDLFLERAEQFHQEQAALYYTPF